MVVTCGVTGWSVSPCPGHGVVETGLIVERDQRIKATNSPNTASRGPVRSPMLTIEIPFSRDRTPSRQARSKLGETGEEVCCPQVGFGFALVDDMFVAQEGLRALTLGSDSTRHT